MLYIYICEDEEVQLNYIREMITEYIADQRIDARIVAARQDPEEIMAELHDYCQPAIFFIDIQLDGYDMDGFDLAGRLYIENPELKVVFVSNYENIVFDAYEYTPLWFVRKSMLERDMTKALQKYFNMTVKTQLRYRMEDGFGFLDVRMELILYAECSRHTIMIHMRNQSSFQQYGSLKTLEEKWKGYGFIRIHKNYLVNAKYVAEVGVRTIRLSDGTELDMGKNRRKMITELVKQQKERIC